MSPLSALYVQWSGSPLPRGNMDVLALDNSIVTLELVNDCSVKCEWALFLLAYTCLLVQEAMVGIPDPNDAPYPSELLLGKWVEIVRFIFWIVQ